MHKVERISRNTIYKFKLLLSSICSQSKRMIFLSFISCYSPSIQWQNQKGVMVRSQILFKMYQKKEEKLYFVTSEILPDHYPYFLLLTLLVHAFMPPFTDYYLYSMMFLKMSWIKGEEKVQNTEARLVTNTKHYHISCIPCESLN